MGRRYSIAEARQLFTQLVREAESGRSFEITRRGRPVAVIVSAAGFARLQGARSSLADAIESFRENAEPGDLLSAADLRNLRSRDTGREVAM
jgi:prevent-host-death family protein